MSAAAWTAARTGSARAGLRGRRRQGSALTLLPKVAAQARDGRLSAEHLRAVGVCAGRHPHLAVEHEELWVEQAEALGAESFGVAARHWLAAADDQAADQAGPDADAPVPVSHLHGSRTLDGWLRVDGLFAPDDADVVDAALGAGVDRMLRAARDGDPSVEGQPASVLRAGVLVDLAAQSMRQEPSDASVPDRYRVAVVVRAGDATEPAEAACDAAAYRVALGAAGEVLDVGRQTNRWPTAMRRAITVRDGGCAFPGCDRPPRGATSTTAPLGRWRRHLRSTTAPCSAGGITASSTDNAGASPSTAAGPSPEDPTAPPTPPTLVTARRRSILTPDASVALAARHDVDEPGAQPKIRSSEPPISAPRSSAVRRSVTRNASTASGS